jgi:hypothetical protein
VHGIPVFSLYGEVRRPTAAMMDSFDVLLVDLQDLGCRIYTFITTLRYVLEAAARHGKSVWVLDRPNPAGRPVEGLSLRTGWESFVGAGAAADAPRPHPGRTGALVRAYAAARRRLQVITMQGWQPDRRGPATAGRSANAPGSIRAPTRRTCGWRALCRHGDARRHDAVRRPRHHAPARAVRRAGPRCTGAAEGNATRSRRTGCRAAGCAPCWFEPTFHKHVGKLCSGLQMHVEDSGYDHDAFRPWRLQALPSRRMRRL